MQAIESWIWDPEISGLYKYFLEKLYSGDAEATKGHMRGLLVHLFDPQDFEELNAFVVSGKVPKRLKSVYTLARYVDLYKPIRYSLKRLLV